MKNGFAVPQDVEYNNHHLNYQSPPQQQNLISHDSTTREEEFKAGGCDPLMSNGHSTTAAASVDNEGLHARKLSSATMEQQRPLSLSAATATTGLKFVGAKDAFSTYDVLWCRTKNWIEAMKHVPWKNGKAPPGRAYTPTEVEHVANVVTHGLWIVPAIFAGLQLLWRSNNNTQRVTALVYGSALTLLFAVSTIFHVVHYCNKDRNLKDLLHRCDRAMIYIFIAGSYYPWLSLAPPAHPTILFLTNWMVWILAALGILYQQMYHEKYKCLETFLYVVMGVGPSLVLILNGHHFKGMDELQIGGVLYIVGILFFKADGKLPFAHAIWHLFVVVAAFMHYYAILKYLY